jgi:hypothetical protein
MLSFPGRLIVLRELLGKRPSSRQDPLKLPLRRTGSLFFNSREKADWYTFESIFAEHEYRTNYQGAVVIDVGAHRGMYSASALLHGAKAVLAYEPARENLQYLQPTL